MGKPGHPGRIGCYICSGTIAGAFVEVEGRRAHPQCYLERPAPRCASCDALIRDRYWLDLWGLMSCARCQAVGTCDYCRAGLRPRPWAKQAACPVCERLAVHDAREAARLYAEVVAWAEGKRFFENFRQPPMMLYTPAQMARAFPEMAGVFGIARKAVWETPLGLSAETEQVVIRSGLPAPLFQTVAAHELGHVWLAAQGVNSLPAREEEGFCEVLAYLWTSDRCTFGREGILRQIADSPDPVYGDGFRAMKALEERQGLIGLMQSIVGRSRIDAHVRRRRPPPRGGRNRFR